MTPEQGRQAAQLAFVASGQPLELGDRAQLPLPLAELLQLTADSPHVVEAIESGLTAQVLRVRVPGSRGGGGAGGCDFTLKRKRAQSLVQNIDGQTSFLNEVQRRSELAALVRAPAASPGASGVPEDELAVLRAHLVPTVYASWLDGVICSPWLDGHHLQRFEPRVFDQVFAVIVALELAGFFEWDLCHRNVIDDGERIALFDFGYMVRFDPRRAFNSNGLSTPLFHGIERFETRSFFGFLLHRAAQLDEAAALALYQVEKQLALAHYQRKHQRLVALGAAPEILSWQAAINVTWAQALTSPAALQRRYLIESFRSHVLDLLDDVHGKTCSARTLARADTVLALLRDHHTLLREDSALFFGDEHLTQPQLLERYRALREQALALQLPAEQQT